MSFLFGIFHVNLIVALSSEILLIVAFKFEITEETELCAKQENVNVSKIVVIKINLFIHI
jgi:hypothetical protein